jgi:hypothetical protein
MQVFRVFCFTGERVGWAVPIGAAEKILIFDSIC